ncbi:hypothetical protein [Streptomyces cuspidosporus]|uniref:Uncharacterized protein n=1 Tax=Streptomyces cuspidosporus TaxID=66882 RepID=A0ABN3FGR7_9ACTN
MAVQEGEYRMWAALARRDDLPDAAHGAIIDGLLPGDGAFESSSWQHGVFKETLPTLLARVTDQGLRDRLIAAGSSDQITELVHQNVLGPDDVPGVLRHHRVTHELIAALARHDAHREVVLALVNNLRLSDLVPVALSCELLCLEDLDRIPRVPDWLLDALVRRGLDLVTAQLNAFGSDQQGGTYRRPPAWPGYEACHLVLERCPDKWPALVEDAATGQAMRHILLDCVATEKISDEVLASCVPALCLPERAALTQPARDHRQRLQHIARRVAAHPRLRDMAGTELKDAADQCVREGRLLHAAKVKRYKPYELTSMAADLALTSGDADQLAKLCTLVSRLPEPVALQQRYAHDDEDEPIRPKVLLSSDSRISAISALAHNPHLDQSLVTGLLERLHPVEVQWLLTYDQEVPAWLQQAAAEHAAAHRQWEVPRILSDTELDTYADPQSVMQGWLDATGDHRSCFYHQVEYAILASRHRTDVLVRQLPAPLVLSDYKDPVASEELLRTCGSDPGRWQAMVETLATSRLDYSETFGQFIDRFKAGCDGS